MNCRHCGAPLALTLIDLGSAPPSNAFLTPDALGAPEKWFPLRVLVCERCWLAQTQDFTRAEELFDAGYVYFSSQSRTWLEHARAYVAAMTSRLSLNGNSKVVEVAANDGYLLQFVVERGIPCLGVEPTSSTAKAARAKGIPITEEFFGVRLARQMVAHDDRADLMVANNVLAHVPDINDFVSGFALMLKDDGVATFEFPHLLRMIDGNQFDTIYHEHFSYLSMTAVMRIFAANGLGVFDVEEHPTHGGSLRVFAQRRDSGRREVSSSVAAILSSEREAGVETSRYYASFQGRADAAKDEFVRFLLDAKRDRKRVVAFGAAAKGNTLLNYAGVRRDLIEFTADGSAAKQGKYLPGSRIPVVDEARLREVQPDFVVLLPWNLKRELMEQLGYVRTWGGRFVTAIPRLEVA